MRTYSGPCSGSALAKTGHPGTRTGETGQAGEDPELERRVHREVRRATADLLHRVMESMGALERRILGGPAAPVPAERRAPRQPGAVPGETVLVVDDEDGVRSLVQRVLERRGYTVIVARSAPEALSHLQDGGPPIHLLIADVVMPRMTGRELVDRFRSANPRLPVLFMSGYTYEVLRNHDALAAGTAFIEKPFSPAALAAVVRAVLDGDAT